MASKTDISNMALAHLGQGLRIANVDTENTAEARECRLFYDFALETLLAAGDWPSHRKTIALGLVDNDPTIEWLFSYQYPANCAKALRIVSGFGDDSNGTRVPYAKAISDTGQLIYTNQEDAELEFIANDVPPDYYTAGFTLALSLLLASLIAPTMTSGDPYGLGARALAKYEMQKTTALANDYNEEQPANSPPQTDLVRSRY